MRSASIRLTTDFRTRSGPFDGTIPTPRSAKSSSQLLSKILERGESPGIVVQAGEGEPERFERYGPAGEVDRCALELDSGEIPTSPQKSERPVLEDHTRDIDLVASGDEPHLFENQPVEQADPRT